MYKEEKTYNVIKGKVPDFRNCLTLGGATPVIKEGLVPVTISDQGVVTKVNEQSKDWYNYCDKQWANAVILTEEGIKQNIEEGKTIDEQYIESYFVWIPKYKYKIFDMGEYTGLSEEAYEEKSQEIEIEFGTENTTDTNTSCTTPMLDNKVQGESGGKGNCSKDKWMTHPAFLAFDTNGFWVGKFETGYKQDGKQTEWSKTGAEKDINDKSKVIIKPNVYSWRSITVKNMFDTSYNYQRDLESHMMKNTEWGAVAYLSHSKYGTCTEIRINNSSNYVTGVAAVNPPTSGLNVYKNYVDTTPGIDNDKSYNYKNKKGTIASTTGNYSGVYDMSGGAWEYVMGVMKGLNNIDFIFGNSGFTKNEIPFKTDDKIDYSKYYDVYDYSVDRVSYQKRIFGDAIGELGPFGLNKSGSNNRGASFWYEDFADFIENQFPWFQRGCNSQCGIQSGIFSFNCHDGKNYDSYSFRIMLAPTNENK